MFLTILELLAAALSIWASKEKTKYIDKVTQLRSDYYAEYNKPDNERSDARLDNLYFELRNLAAGFAAEVRATNASS